MSNNDSKILAENTLYSSNLGVQSIPEISFSYPKLEKLDLSYNKLESLDERIGDLKDLKDLDLSNNKLRELPASFAQLKALEVLSLSNNPWVSFPEIITQLPKLKVLKLKGKQIQILPNTICALKALEYLDLSFNPIQDLPEGLASLKKLKTLICTSNEFTDFPKVLLEMEQLKNLDLLDLDFRLKLPIQGLELFFKVLRQLKKQKASLETKAAAFDIFFGKTFDGDLSLLLPLLLVNYVEFSQSIRDYMIQHYSKTLNHQSEIAVLGKTAWIDFDKLSMDIIIQDTIQPNTTHVLIGRSITKQQVQELHPDLAFISEKQLLSFINPKQPADWMAAHQDKILDLLRSENNENIALALQMTKDNELLDELLTELLVAYTFIDAGNSDLRNEFKEVFYRRITNFEQINLPGASFRFYTPHKTENAIFQGIQNITEQAKEWDGLKLAHYLFDEYQVAYTYILAKSNPEAEKRWLQQFIAGDTIYLGTLSKLKELPLGLLAFKNIRNINLRGCNFRKFPKVELLAQMPNLEQIDLRDNPLTGIPRALYSALSRYKILLTK